MQLMTDGTSLIGLLVFLLITLAAEILGTIGGFGSSLFFVSAAQFFFDMQTVLGLTGLLHIFSNSSKIFLFRKSIDWRLALLLGIPSTVLALIGAWLTTRVGLGYSKLVLGCFLTGFGLLMLVKPRIKIPPTQTNAILGGSVAGFLAGFIGTGGAIRGLLLTSFALERNLLIGTSATIDFGVDLTRTFIYVENGYLSAEMTIYVPILIIASYAGSYIGKRLVSRISEMTFRRVLLATVIVMGGSLIVGSF